MSLTKALGNHEELSNVLISEETFHHSPPPLLLPHTPPRKKLYRIILKKRQMIEELKPFFQFWSLNNTSVNILKKVTHVVNKSWRRTEEMNGFKVTTGYLFVTIVSKNFQWWILCLGKDINFKFGRMYYQDVLKSIY